MKSPVYMMGGFCNVSAVFDAEPKITKAFESGQGVGWGEHHENVFCGTAKFFRTTGAGFPELAVLRFRHSRRTHPG